MSRRLRVACAAAAGVASVLALPPWNAAPLAWVALVPLLVAQHGASRRLTVSLAVVYAVVLIVGDVGPWLARATRAYFALPGARAALVTLPALGAVAAAHGAALGLLLGVRPRRAGPWDVLFVGAAWAVWDAVRTRVFPYYPGGFLALSQHATTPVLQVASVAGIAGVSFLVAGCNAGLTGLIVAREGRRRAGAALGVGLALGAAGLGGLRVVPEPDGGPSVATVDVGAASASAGSLERYLAASADAPGAGAALLVWPESALAGDPTRDPALLAPLLRFVGASRVPLLAGGLGSSLRADRRGFVEFNSAHLVGAAGRVETYHKRLLVPFAEAWPALLGPPPATLGPVAAGREPILFPLDPETTFGVVICFEVTAPAGARELAGRGARFLVNLTNDVWFTDAPHLPWAAVRAVETGLPIVRAANANVSGVFDRFGRLRVARRGGVLVASLPPASLTLYARGGDVFLLACAAVALLQMARRC